MSDSDDQMWKPPTAADVAEDNPRMIAGELRALKRDVNAGFESMAQALKAFERIDGKLDVIIDRQNVTDRRMDALDARITALETAAAGRRRK